MAKLNKLNPINVFDDDVVKIIVHDTHDPYNTIIQKKNGNLHNGYGHLIGSEFSKHKDKVVAYDIETSALSKKVTGKDIYKPIQESMAITIEKRKPTLVFGKVEGQSISIPRKNINLSGNLSLSAPEMNSILKIIRNYFGSLSPSDIAYIIAKFKEPEVMDAIKKNECFNLGKFDYYRLIKHDDAAEELEKYFNDEEDLFLGGFAEDVYNKVWQGEPYSQQVVSKMLDKGTEESMESVGLAIKGHKKVKKLVEVLINEYGVHTLMGDMFNHQDNEAHKLKIGGEDYYFMAN